MSAAERRSSATGKVHGEGRNAEGGAFLELTLVRAVGNVRIALLVLILVVALSSPSYLVSPLALHTGLIIGVFLTLWTRYAARWDELHRAGRIDIATLVIMLGDITWLGLFVLGTGGVESPFVAILVVPILFAATAMGMLHSAVALTTGIIVLLLVAFSLSQPLTPAGNWRIAGLAFAFIAVGWVAWGLCSALERERRTNELIIHFMDEAVVLIDDGGYIRLVNPQIERFVRLPASEIIGLNVEHLPRKKRYDALRHILAAARSDEEVHDVEIRPHDQLELRISTVHVSDPVGRRIAQLIICQDITDLKALARAHASGVRFLSHEIRSPLTTLKIISAVFSELAAQLTDEGARRLVEILDREVDRMLRLARQFLDLAALEEDTYQLSLQSTDIAALVHKVAESLRIRAEARGLNLTVSCPATLPTVQADPDRLEDVLHNLGDNALKYTESGGEVRLEVSAGDGEVRISVSDTGCGIPEEQQEAIFQEFVRGPQHQEGSGTDGLGLGLFLARQIVTMLGGRIELHSVEGVGSTFTVCLPASAET